MTDKDDQPMSLDTLQPAGRGTAKSRGVKEKNRTGKVDGRTLRRTGRSEQIIVRTTPEYRKLLESIATAEGIGFNETVERALLALERELKGNFQS